MNILILAFTMKHQPLQVLKAATSYLKTSETHMQFTHHSYYNESGYSFDYFMNINTNILKHAVRKLLSMTYSTFILICLRSR